MRTTHPIPRARPRAYLLLEAMVGGAILAVALTTAMSFVGFYRREVTVAARRAEASAICIAVADELVARPFGTGSGAYTPYPGHPNFNVTWSITRAGLESRSVPPLVDGAGAIDPDALHLISVEVEFPAGGSVGSPATATLTYERLKRRPQ